MPDDNYLDSLATEIKFCYLGVMRKMRGSVNYCRNIATQTSFWPEGWNESTRRAAMICVECNCTAETYVRAQNMFCQLVDKHGALLVTQLHSPSAKKFVERYKQEAQHPLRFVDNLYIQQQYLARAIKNTDRSVESILMDDMIDFTAWFRILATTTPNEKIIQKYGERARSMLTSDLRIFLENQKYRNGEPYDLGRIR